ncbi:hypothetical protein M9H77_18338 [Catharanthus roseus]|uniref:Uncharacterized protein n=1 Tax=Catharanthus roseus TaxID=4058 RepID=A0ACC0B759_CATRO|nr:hypothetical protein M9H77_18338 [Catharanthus roseus]
MIMCDWKCQRIELYVERNTLEGLTQLVLSRTLHHALQWNGRLVESQEGLKTKVGLRADLVGIGCHVMHVDGFIMSDWIIGPVVQEAEFEAEIEEDPSEPKTDPKMVAELEREVPVELGWTDTLMADFSPLVYRLPLLYFQSDSTSVDTVCDIISDLKTLVGTS